MAFLDIAEPRPAVGRELIALRDRGDVPAWLSAGLPLGVVGFVLALIMVAAVRVLAFGQSTALSPTFGTIMGSERGPLELGTAVLAFVAVGMAIHTLVRARQGGAPSFLLGWIGAHLLGALYLGGEEISWGQHLLGWETSGWFAENNDQFETNLHNTSSWLDQKPRLLLFLWCLIGGILVPLIERRRGIFPGSAWTYWVWPTRACLIAGLAVVLVRIPAQLIDLFGASVYSPARVVLLPLNLTEVQEFLFASFILIYMVSLMRRTVARFAPH